MTAETAILLGHAFDVSPEFWVNLQARYDLDAANASISEESVHKADAFAQELRAG